MIHPGCGPSIFSFCVIVTIVSYTISQFFTLLRGCERKGEGKRLFEIFPPLAGRLLEGKGGGGD